MPSCTTTAPIGTSPCSSAARAASSAWAMKPSPSPTARRLVAAIARPPAQSRKELEDPPLVPAPGHRAGGHQQVLAHRQLGEDPAALRNERDAGARDPVRRLPRHLVGPDANASAARPDRSH